MQTRLIVLLTASVFALGTTAVAQAASTAKAVDPQRPPDTIDRESGSATTIVPQAKGDAGSAMPRASVESGTTTSYVNIDPTKPVEWPCAQRRVPTISAGTIWSGPDLKTGKAWEQNNEIAALARTLASRRLPITETDPLIAGFAERAGAAKDEKLTQLFVAVLEIINTDRSDILRGIMRYAQGQERLAERMRTESDKISEAQQDVQGPTGIAATETNRDFVWDQRIFKERKQALSYVCETPSLLERRAFDIGKRIQAQLSPTKG